jgi:DNA segregation ATPase FtsK/SpoIIIE, S-DNA-T family
MNHSILRRRILRSLAIVAVLALATVGLQRAVAALPQAGDSAATTQAEVQVAAQPTATATVAASSPAQLQVVAQPTATATVTAPPPAQVQVAAQPTATATVAAPPPVQVEVEGTIIAVDAAAGTITVQDDDGGPAAIVSVGAVGSYHVGQEVEVVGTPTGTGGSAATVQAQAVQVEAPEAAEPGEAQEAPEAAEPGEAQEAPEAAEPPEAPEPPDND